MTRSIHRKDAVTSAGKVVLKRLSLWMPMVTLSTEAAMHAQEWMLARNSLTAYWQVGQIDSLAQQEASSLTWKITTVSGTEHPLHIFIAFQKSSCRGDQKQCWTIVEA